VSNILIHRNPETASFVLSRDARGRREGAAPVGLRVIASNNIAEADENLLTDLTI
jgi:hypothetical protein